MSVCMNINSLFVSLLSRTWNVIDTKWTRPVDMYMNVDNYKVRVSVIHYWPPRVVVCFSKLSAWEINEWRATQDKFHILSQFGASIWLGSERQMHVIHHWLVDSIFVYEAALLILCIANCKFFFHLGTHYATCCWYVWCLPYFDLFLVN